MVIMDSGDIFRSHIGYV